MTWQEDALRHALDSKKMSSHLQQMTRLQTDDNPLTRLSSKNMQNKDVLVPLQFNTDKNHVLLDTGAVQSALSEIELRKITTAHSEEVLNELPLPTSKSELPTHFSPHQKKVLIFHSRQSL